MTDLDRSLESETLEYKSSFTDTSAILKTIAAMANCKGGQIWVGVEDSGAVRGVDRTSLNNETISKLHGRVERDLNPAPHVVTNFVQREGKDVLIITIERYGGPQLCYFRRVQCFVRRGAQNLELGLQQAAELLARKMQQYDPWDQKDSGLTITDINLDLAREKLGIQGEIFEHLRARGLLRDTSPNNACLVWFGRNELFIGDQIGFGIDIFSYTDDESTKLRDPAHLDGPLALLMEHAIDEIAQRTRPDLMRSGLRNRMVNLISPIALREALFNAMLHRRFDGLRQNCQVHVYPSSVRISSQGTPGNPELFRGLKHAGAFPGSEPTNPKIFDVGIQLRYCERAGGGLKTIFQEQHSQLLPLPRFSFDENRTTLTFAVAEGDIEHNALQSILSVLDTSGPLTAAEIATRTGRDVTAIRTSLGELAQQDRVSRVGHDWDLKRM